MSPGRLARDRFESALPSCPARRQSRRRGEARIKVKARNVFDAFTRSIQERWVRQVASRGVSAKGVDAKRRSSTEGSTSQDRELSRAPPRGRATEQGAIFSKVIGHRSPETRGPVSWRWCAASNEKTFSS